MPDAENYSVRRELYKSLMEKVDEDRYPSSTMLDMIESLLDDEDVPTYAESLMKRIREDRFPSISLLRRVQSLT